MSVALQGENDKPAGGIQFWHRAEEMKPQERRDRSGREANKCTDGDTDRVRRQVSFVGSRPN